MKYVFCITLSILFIFFTGCTNVTTQSSESSQSMTNSQSLNSSQSMTSSQSLNNSQSMTNSQSSTKSKQSSTISSKASSVNQPTAWPKLVLVNAYPQLAFNQPLEYLVAPGNDNRAFVVGKPGLIYVFDNNPKASSTGIFLEKYFF